MILEFSLPQNRFTPVFSVPEKKEVSELSAVKFTLGGL